MPGSNSAPKRTAFGNMESGIYAPTRKPIAALIMPVKAPCAPCVEMNEQIITDSNAAKSADSAVSPTIPNTSLADKYQPVSAR